MKRLRHFFPAFSLLLVSLLSQSASAQWTSDPTLNTTVRDQASLEATVTMIATAPNGNSYISWAEGNGSGYEMHMQLVDSNGYNLWGSTGIVVDATLGETLYRYDMKVDDSGNAVLAVQDARSGVDWPVVYKIDQSGNEVWGADGIQLTDASATSGLSPVLSFTDSNNVLVAWTAQGTKAFVSFQKLSPTGSFMWADNGNIIDDAGTVNYERAVFVRTSGEQFIIQYEKRSGFGLGVSTMYAQSYNSDASTVWASPTEVSTSSIGFAAFPAPIPDGYGGFFVTFTSGNPSSASISEDYAQRVYSDGHIWAAVGDELGSGTTQERFDGGAVYVPSQNKYYACISNTDLSQGASGITLQEIDTSGNNLLGANGQTLLPLSDGTNATIVYITGIKSTDTGLVVLYEVGTEPSPVTIKALGSNFNGDFNWTDTSAVVSAAPSNKMKYGWGNYIHNQFVAAWTDMRLSSGGVYAQNILGNGHLGAPPACATIVVAADTTSGTVGSAYADTLSQVGGVTPVIYTLTGGTLPDGVTLGTNGLLSGTPMTSGTYTFLVTVTDSNGCTGSQNDTVVINCPTVSLAAFPSLCDTASALTLTGGLPAGGVYSGDGVANGTFTPTPGDTGTFHITYTYTVGNCTDSASQLLVVTTCGDTTNAVRNVAAQDLFQCIPNPSNGVISVRFNNSVSGLVTVKMLDMTGRLLWTDEQSANGSYNKTFNISSYAKGIYLLQVSSSAGENVMKITLQ